MTKIDGVKLTPLSMFEDERGAVLHFIKKSSSVFNEFGEVYFSKVNPGYEKGWKLHRKISQRVVVPMGEVKFKIVDMRASSLTYGATDEFVIGQSNYAMCEIPAGVYYSFKSNIEEVSLIANLIDSEHDPKESIVLPLETESFPDFS